MQLSRSNRPRIVASVLVFAVSASAVAQKASGALTGDIKMSLEPPAMGGNSPGRTALQGTVTFANGKARIDIASASGPAIDFRTGDFVLLPDSAKSTYLRPTSKEFWEMDSPFLNPYAQLMGQAGQISATAAQVSMSKLGDGDSVGGFATRKFRITAEYSVSAGGMNIPSSIAIDFTVARTPVKFAGAPLAGVQAFSVANSPGLLPRVLGYLSEASADGVIVRARATASFSVQGNTLSTIITSEVTGLRAVDVDAAKLTMPAGFKPGG